MTPAERRAAEGAVVSVGTRNAGGVESAEGPAIEVPERRGIGGEALVCWVGDDCVEEKNSRSFGLDLEDVPTVPTDTTSPIVTFIEACENNRNQTLKTQLTRIWIMFIAFVMTGILKT